MQHLQHEMLLFLKCDKVSLESPGGTERTGLVSESSVSETSATDDICFPQFAHFVSALWQAGDEHFNWLLV